MNYQKAKAAIDDDAVRAFQGKSRIELDGLVNFLREEIINAKWEIVKNQQRIESYQRVVDAIEKSQQDPNLRDNELIGALPDGERA